MEVTLDDVAGGDRLAGRILPTGSCEGALDLWGERTKHGEDREPHEEYDPEMRGHPTAEASEDAGRPHGLLHFYRVGSVL